MDRLSIMKRGVFLLYAFFMSVSIANAKFIVVNDNIISPKASAKIESLGQELYLKTGVNVYVAATKSLNKVTIKEYEKSLLSNLKKPFVILALAKDEQKVDIMNSRVLDDKFDKESTLSPFPWSGTIIPLLSVKKANDKYNAALFNGYADIVEQIADSYDVKLEGAIGNTNKSTYQYLQIIIYGFLLIIFGRYIYQYIGRKNDKK